MANLKTGTTKINVEVLVPVGLNQATAAQIKAIWAPCLILAVGNETGGLTFPVASKGKLFYVKNIATQMMATLILYPFPGDNIDIQGVNNPLVMQPLASAMFIADSNHRWHSLPAISS